MQHLPLGGLVPWDMDLQMTDHASESTPDGTMVPDSSTAVRTGAPWVSSSIHSNAGAYPHSVNFSMPRGSTTAVRPDGILPARAPLGPTASTTLRIMHAVGSGDGADDSICATHISESQQRGGLATERRK